MVFYTNLIHRLDIKIAQSFSFRSKANPKVTQKHCF